jgi:hypothetical protein
LQTRYEACLVREDEARKIHREEYGSDDDDDDEEDGDGEGEGDEDDDDDEDEEDEGTGRGLPSDVPSAPADDDADVVNEADVIHHRMLREKLGKGRGGVASVALASTAAGASAEAAAEDKRDMQELIENPPPRGSPVDHVQHLMHLAKALAGLAADPLMPAVQTATPPEVLGKLRALVAAAERLAAEGTAPGELGPAPPKADAT